MIQPCEICGNRAEHDTDLFRRAMPGTRAARKKYRFRRICGHCVAEEPTKVQALVEREDNYFENRTEEA